MAEGGTYGLLDRFHALSVKVQVLVAVVVAGVIVLGLWLVLGVQTSVLVTYEVTGTARMADITYENGSGDPAQQDDIDVPLQRKSDGGQGIEVTMNRGQFFYLSAQNQEDKGSITCTVKVDGKVVKTTTSHGGYTIATCSGRA